MRRRITNKEKEVPSYWDYNFFTVGNSNQAMLSNDGINWLDTANLFGNANWLERIGDSVYCCSSNGLWLLDGSRITRVATVTNLRDIAYGNGIYVAISSTGTNIYSNDGINFTTIANVGVNGKQCVAFDEYNQLFYMVDAARIVYSSSNGVNWTTVTTISSFTNSPTRMIIHNRQIIICSNDGIFRGTAFTSLNLLNNTNINTQWYSVRLINGSQVVATNANTQGIIAYASNVTGEFTVRSFGNEVNTITDVAWKIINNAGRFVFSLSAGRMMYMDNIINGTPTVVQTIKPNQFNSVI